MFSVAYQPENTKCEYDLYKNSNLSWIEDCLVKQYKDAKISPYQFYSILARLLVNDNEIIRGELFHLHGDSWFDIPHWNYTASRLFECIEAADASGKSKIIFMNIFKNLNLLDKSGQWKHVKIKYKQRISLIQAMKNFESKIAEDPDFLKKQKIGESYGPPCDSVQLINQ